MICASLVTGTEATCPETITSATDGEYEEADFVNDCVTISTNLNSIGKQPFHKSDMAHMYVPYVGASLSIGQMAFKKAPDNGLGPLTVYMQCQGAPAGCAGSPCTATTDCSGTSCLSCPTDCTTRTLDADTSKQWLKNAQVGLSFVTYCSADSPSLPPPSPSPPSPSPPSPSPPPPTPSPPPPSPSPPPPTTTQPSPPSSPPAAVALFLTFVPCLSPLS